eukprot:s444_g17.t4
MRRRADVTAAEVRSFIALPLSQDCGCKRRSWPTRRRRGRRLRRRLSRIRGPDGYPRFGSKVHELLTKEAALDVPALQAELSEKAQEALRRGHRCDASVFDGEVLCISLPSCKSRRRHTEKELTCWGFPLPRFVEALGPNDEEVLRWFNSPSLGGKSENVSCFLSLRVAKFPPCFRCGLVTDCCCANNDMLLEQVANWLSFRKAWTEIANSTKEWHLLVEDDVKFTHKAAECWNELVTPELLQENTGTAWASSAGSLTAVGIQRVPELRNPGACQLADLALETCDENE